MNAGVPLGGTDIEKLLLRSAIDAKVPSVGIAKMPEDKRIALLQDIRELKHTAAEQFFKAPADGSDDTFANVSFDRILKQFPAGVAMASADPGNLKAFRQEATERMKMLTELSVHGLFRLIPSRQAGKVTKILLTGRASLLKQIRDAVIKQAGYLEKMGAAQVDVVTLKQQYHLKLAVAYGCALAPMDATIPTTTLGRRLVVNSSTDLFVEFNGDCPISGSAPTLWQLNFPRLGKDVRYELWEYRTALAREFVLENQSALMRMGCFRLAAKWTVEKRGGDPNPERKLVAWHPATDGYFMAHSFEADDLPPASRWIKRNLDTFDLTDTNLVTGLPVGFPHEVR